MKNSSILAVAIVLLALLGYLAVRFLSVEAAVAKLSNTEPDRIVEKVDGLARAVTALEESVRSLQGRIETLPAPSPARFSQREIEEAVARALETREAERDSDASILRPGLTAALAAETKEPDETLDLPKAIEQLAKLHNDWNGRQALWKRIQAAGQQEAAVAAFEKRAQENPSNPDFQVDLGNAYLQKLQTVTEGPERGVWAIKADQTFDRALEIDDHHWQARFQKATSLAFWPPIFGKQNEAIKHFEILAEQQKEALQRPEFSQTYIFLGNIYQQAGKTDKAKETWKKGLELFPEVEEFKKQLNLAK